ncbi:MAG: gfo/Idh/MocA family oxidoreductase [Marinilabiliales bacterium]|nr:MAG: gfo/Idh/MocA family oxidoreductase [Marinilabiliales bacterium]
MKTSRRDFIRLTGLAGAGLAGAGFAGCTDRQVQEAPFRMTHNQVFNMSGYAAPRLETVRVGLIGVGSRGFGALRRHVRIEGLQITALADLDPARVNRGREFVRDHGHDPAVYSGSEDAWKGLCERDDVDLVYICTPWHLHTPNSVYAMENGKHAATEIPAAQTMDECWQLVETSERTRRHCIMLENVCYDFFEMMTLNMARQGFFGEIIHGEGAYIHDLMDMNFSKTAYANMWRLEENSRRNGSLYPMHGLGSVAQIMDVNYGDRMDYLVSLSSNDFMMGRRAEELATEDEFWQDYAGRDYRGNINTTLIKTSNGRSIMIQHDVSSPRPYTRIHLISGTKGIARKWPSPARIATSHHGWLPDEEFRKLEEQYTPEITKRVGEMARQVGGHGGMDTLMDWRLIDCLRNGLPLDMDVYDAAAWSSIIPLSEWSVANRSMPVDIPDFTAGAWKTNKPLMDINLEKGGNTLLI